MLLVLAATFCFAVSDVLTKHLTGLYPVPLVVASRYLASLAILIVFVAPRIGRRLWHTARPGLVILRGAVLTLASFTLGFALKLMPVGETVAIVYLSPFAVMIIAIPLLGERVSRTGWVLAILGFAGVLLILRPGGGLDPVGVAFAVANAACATIFQLMTRTLSRTETSISLLFYVTLTGAISFTILAIPSLSGPLPAMADLGLMALLGVIATGGHFLFALAYAQAPVSLLAPINYTHLVWGAVLGWLVFAHLPDGPSLAGMALVAGSGALLALHSHRASRAARAGVETGRI